MGFRDDHLATRARADALQEEVARLREENERLRRGDSAGEATGEATGVEPSEPRAPILAADDGAEGLVYLAGLGAVAAVAALWLTGVGAATLGPAAGLALSAAGAGIVVGLLVYALRRNRIVVPPDRVVVLQGRRAYPSGRAYRVVRGETVVRQPLLERADELYTGPLRPTLRIARAYVRGNDAARLEARVRGGVETTEPQVHDAIERFLGRGAEEMAEVLVQTLEGTAREVLARHTLEELRADPNAFAQAVCAAAEDDLASLGLRVEHLEVLALTSADDP